VVCMVNKHYYTYSDLMDLFSCSKKTLERKLSLMNIRKRYLSGKGKPYFLVLDIHSQMEFNKCWEQCTQREKQYLRELLNEA